MGTIRATGLRRRVTTNSAPACTGCPTDLCGSGARCVYCLMAVSGAGQSEARYQNDRRTYENPGHRGDPALEGLAGGGEIFSEGKSPSRAAHAGEDRGETGRARGAGVEDGIASGALPGTEWFVVEEISTPVSFTGGTPVPPSRQRRGNAFRKTAGGMGFVPSDFCGEADPVPETALRA